MFSRPVVAFFELILFFACLSIPANRAFELASNNIHLDSPLYLY
jgi:hypothetical protein